MNIWLVTVGEPLPTDDGSPRLLRAGILADLLSRRGHRVHWWSSSFDHQLKRQRADAYTRIDYQPNATLHLLPGRAYDHNLSFARIGNHRDNAAAFATHARQLNERPDVILSSYPTIELCRAAVAYGNEQNVPVVLDVRDLWPDVFERLAPDYLRPLAHLVLAPMRRQARRALSGADAVAGITREFVDWGCAIAGRKAASLDRAFPLAYSDREPEPHLLAQARDRWHALGVDDRSKNLVFFGTLGRQFDLSTVIRAARACTDAQIRFIVCGMGDRLADYRAEAADCPNVIFPGWIDAPMIRALMPMARAGLAPYVAGENFEHNIPNKIVEYLAGGLPVVTTLGGVPGALLIESRCGVTYRHGDAPALLQTVLRLVADEPARSAMAGRALQLFRDRFDADRVYGEMIDYLRDVARHPGRAAGRALAEVAA